MTMTKKKMLARNKRKLRVRKKVFGTTSRPRLSIFRSTKHIYAQIIDDTIGETLVSSASNEKIILEHGELKGKCAVAKAVGGLIAKRAQDKGIKQVVFDRNGFLYHGRIKAISEGAREAGLDF